ncbi:MAG TPA: hypothetical protein VFR36_01905, partial [Sphingomicrobium sp.]|nr:hypothetical protein [Sphingomicrobium sp.]
MGGKRTLSRIGQYQIQRQIYYPRKHRAPSAYSDPKPTWLLGSVVGAALYLHLTFNEAIDNGDYRDERDQSKYDKQQWHSATASALTLNLYLRVTANV